LLGQKSNNISTHQPTTRQTVATTIKTRKTKSLIDTLCHHQGQSGQQFQQLFFVNQLASRYNNEKRVWAKNCKVENDNDSCDALPKKDAVFEVPIKTTLAISQCIV